MIFSKYVGRFFLLSVVMVFGCVQQLTAQNREEYPRQIKIRRVEVLRTDDSLRVEVEFDFSTLSLNPQHSLVVRPVLVAQDERQGLMPVVVSGRVRNLVLQRRSEEERNQIVGADSYVEVRRNNGRKQGFVFQQTLPLVRWMRDAHLALDFKVTGCADCDLPLTDAFIVADKPLFKPVYQPQYLPLFVEPTPEPIKVRSESAKAFLNYRVARAEILPHFGQNAQELERIRASIEKARKDKNLTVTRLTVTGYASPEGIFVENMGLSERRAKALADYIAKNFGWKREGMDVRWYGEDWDSLVRAVQVSDLSDREAVLEIVRRESDHDARDLHLKALSGGLTYQKLLTEYYPQLRRNEYRIEYTVRSFNLEEAKQIVKTRPDLLSLNELYLVAKSYPEGSDEREKVFEIAYRLFPDSAEAIVNKSAQYLQVGEASKARELLERVKTLPLAWNNLALAAALQGDYDMALSYWTKAAQNHSSQAKHNLAELEKRIETERDGYVVSFPR